jgi:putative intracellular protease/amidase
LVLRWHHAKVQLRRWYEEGANIAGSCIGTFILAEAGLLDNAEATLPGGARQIAACLLSGFACRTREISAPR